MEGEQQDYKDYLQTRSGRTYTKWVVFHHGEQWEGPSLIRRDAITGKVADYAITLKVAIPLPSRFDSIADQLSSIENWSKAGPHCAHKFRSMLAEPEKYTQGWVDFLKEAALIYAPKILTSTPFHHFLPREERIRIVARAVENWEEMYLNQSKESTKGQPGDSLLLSLEDLHDFLESKIKELVAAEIARMEPQWGPI